MPAFAALFRLYESLMRLLLRGVCDHVCVCVYGIRNDKTRKIYSKNDGRILHHSHHQQREKKKKRQNSNVSECIHVHAATTEILGLEMTLRIRK